MKTSNVIIGLLSAILLVGGWGLYSYQRELKRKANERCDKAHADFQYALASRDWTYTTPKLEREIRTACDGKALTSEETADLKQGREELQNSSRESLCEHDLQHYGSKSAVARQDCLGTTIGKKAGF